MWHFILPLLLCVGFCQGDTPANCTRDEIIGEWIFYEGPIGTDPNIDCSGTFPTIHRKIKVTLTPTTATEDNWVVGTWTMVYNQGFEVFLNLRNYFAWSKYEQKNGKVTSFCDRTLVGRSHDVTLRHWACFYGVKQAATAAKTHQDPFHTHHLLADRVPSRAEHERIVNEVNRKQTSWTAAIHEPFVNMNHDQLLKVRGGKRSWLPHKVKAIKHKILGSEGMTQALDWRNVNGTDYVSPVRNQGSCGSCYAFSSTGMLENRLRVFTQNKIQVTLSPQDIVSCTDLSQGCEGGFPYLIAGKYGWEKGVVDEKCAPYNGMDSSCPRERCDRRYTGNYGYVGGFYGGCSELAMMQALRSGPVSVSFEVQPDFYHYKSGIYHYTGVKGMEPFIAVNHAVLLVGFGTEANTGEKYWIVKNSWGEDWGDKGYFKIRKGVDEVGIESIAVVASPIPY